MADAQATSILRPLRRWLDTLASKTSSDHQLLERFLRQRDESAFAVLMNRHGPMVLGVCRRFLHQSHDIEDAFQATFLVLARQAGSIRKQESLGCWLHGVARRVASKLRASALRQPLIDRRSPRRTCVEPSFEVAARELQEVLDDELQRLPDKYRLPLVLCYLEGRTHEEVAHELDWPVGTVKGRLARARDLLRGRLTRRGLTLSAEALATFLAAATVPAVVPATLTAATLKTLGGDAPLPIAELATQAIHGLSAMRLKSIGAVLLLVSAVGSGVGLLAHHRLGLSNALPAAPPSQASPSGSGKAATPPRTDLYGDPLPPGAVARMGTIRLSGGREALVFSADSKTISAIDHLHLMIRSWDVRTGLPVRRTPLQISTDGRIPPLFPFTTTRDGKALAAAAIRSDALHVWDAATGKECCRISASRGYPRALAISEDGRMLAACFNAGQADNSIHLLDTKTGAERRQLRGHEGRVAGLVFSPNGKQLASASMDGTVRLWKTDSGEQLHKLRLSEPFRNQPLAFDRLTFSPDGKLLAAAAADTRKVKLWDVSTGKEETDLEMPSKGTIVSLDFSRDGKMLAAAGGKSIALWDIATRKPLRHWTTPLSHAVRFSPDGRVLASSANGKIHLWDVATGKPLHSWPGHAAAPYGLFVSEDGKTIISMSRFESTFYFWDIATGRLRDTLPTEGANFLAASLSADSKHLAASLRGGTLKVWRLPDGKEVRRLDFEPSAQERTESFVLVCRLSADGTRLAAIGRSSLRGSASFQLVVWNVSTGKRLVSRRLPVGTETFSSRFAPDDRTVAIPRPDGVVVQDMYTGQERLTLPRDTGAPLSFSPDGQILAAAIYKPRPSERQPLSRRHEDIEEIGFWELATGQLIGRVKTGPVAPLAFAPTGRLLATAGADALILWNLTTGKPILHRSLEKVRVEMASPSSSVHSIAFTPDGRYLPAGMVDGSILVWDVSAARKAISRPRELDDKELDRAWTDLAGEASAAWPAIGMLTATAPQTLALFKKRLRPVAAASAERLRRLLAELDSPDFATRTDAARELEKLGDLAAPALRRALEDKPSLETRRRIESVLSAGRFVHQPEALRRLRAVRVLEQIGTSEAQRLLRKLAEGDPSARETAAAREAWTRGQRRAKP